MALLRGAKSGIKVGDMPQCGAQKGYASVAMLLMASLIAACDQTEQQPAAVPPPAAVTVAKVARVDVTPSLSFTGRIEAVDKVDLRARVEGFIDKQLFDEGADVKAGDLLFVLEKAPYEAEVEQVKASIARAEATLRVAELSAERQTTLVKKSVAAQAVLDEALAKQGEAKGDLQRQQAALKQAELDLSYTDIRTPLSGRIGRATYSTGDFVGPSSGTLATVVSQDPIYVTFPVSQRELLDIRRQAEVEGLDARAMQVKVRLADGSIYDEVGRLNFVDVEVNPATDTIAVRAQLPNPKRHLIDGQLVTAIVESSKPESALVVPGSALQIDQTGRFVLAVDAENKVEVRRIEIGRGYDGNIVVTKGLNEGERVITIGTQKVRPQQVVEPTEASAEAPAS